MSLKTDHVENPGDLEPARVQFIERIFGDACAGAGFDSDQWRSRFLRWAHQRLFIDGASVSEVRSEWNRHLRRTHLVAVTSGKGGVGKTTVAVNLAIAFAQQGLRTLLFDADLGMANVHIFAGLNPTRTLLDVIDRRMSLAEAMTPGPGGIAVICGASGVGRLTDLEGSVLDRLSGELRQAAEDFDVLVMDTGAGISASVMHFLELAQDTVVVATPNPAAILDAYGVIKCVRENRCATEIHLLINQADAESQAERVQERIASCASRFLQIAISNLGFLFRDPAVENASQSRLPLILSQPNHVNSWRIAKIAESLAIRAAGVPIETAEAEARTAAA